ncbi:bidirectional sugar transporter SWEET5-like [Nymphaea colorata]|nr:bidirectional sugar transporter SWEET5-like [Nymphaea colorata]
MVAVRVVRSIVGVLGNAISFGLFLSPTPTFYKIIKKGAVEDYSAMPYLATMLNCMLWCTYGLPMVHPHSLLVITINGIGLVVETIYLTLYLIYATTQQRVKVILIFLGECVFLAIVLYITLGVLHTYEKRSTLVGTLCIIFGTCMYAAPLSVMKLVVTTKSVEYMPFTLSFVSLINGVCWTLYSFLPLDINILIPNGLGTLLALAQLILYACYFKSTPTRSASRNERGEVREIEMHVG